MLTWKERLQFRENELMLVKRGLAIVTPHIEPPKGVTAWGGGRDQVRALCLIVNREDSIRPDRILRTIQLAFTLRCETVLITPNCYEANVAHAIERARALQSIGAPESTFREPVVDLQACARFAKGGHVWIVSTASPGGAREASILDVYVADDVMYSLELEPASKPIAVPQSDVFATAAEAQADGRRFNRAMGEAIAEDLPLRDANERVK